MLANFVNNLVASPRPLHEAVEHHLAVRLVEINGELIAIYGGDGAGAEFWLEDAAGRVRYFAFSALIASGSAG